MNVRAMDLNLLPVLEAVLVEGNATRAAAKLGLTQPAVSNALARMRKVFGDPLVLKGRRGLVPTPRAIELRAEVSAALDALDRALRPKEALSLASTRREWSLSFADHYGSLLLPKLMGWVAQNAPMASVKVLPLSRMIAEDGLASGGVDIYLGIPRLPMPGCHVRHFFDDEWVCVGAKGAAGARTLEQFLARGHVKSQITQGRGNEVDDALTSLRRTRRIALTVPNYTMAIDVAAGTDLLAVVPRSLATMNAGRLRVMKLPVDVEAMSVSMYWHRRVHGDPGVRALRAGLLALVGADRRLKTT